jgi:hypothetical protein
MLTTQLTEITRMQPVPAEKPVILHLPKRFFVLMKPEHNSPFFTQTRS